MSAWDGTGAPAARVDGTLHTFPHVNQGGREEEWAAEVDESWKNLDGEVIEGDLRLRFKAKYTWSHLSTAQVQTLTAWYNQRQRVMWRPHVDVPSAQILCRIVSFDPAPGKNVHRQSVVTLALEEVSLVEAIPVPNLSVRLILHPKSGVVKT